MARENPEFAQRVSEYYSLEHGQGKSAASGELAWEQMATELLERSNPLGDAAYYGPLISRVAARMAADQGAKKHKDDAYFRRMIAAMQTPTGEDRSLQPVEFVWEAYFFLRKRDGEGSPLPAQDDVKQHAALIWAFADLKLLAKLPEYLWQYRGLTVAETERLLRQKDLHMGPR